MPPSYSPLESVVTSDLERSVAISCHSENQNKLLCLKPFPEVLLLQQ